MIINLIPDDYYTQRNNKIEPFEACMPTSRVMFYKGNKVPYENVRSKEYADDDYFMFLLNTKGACAIRDDKYSKMKHIPPNQIHGMYHTFLDPIVCGKRISDFYTNLSFDQIVALVKQGYVIMTSGAFQGQNSYIDGHAFDIVGVDDNECLRLADPYGDFHTKYTSKAGYDVRMSRLEFAQHVKPIGMELKWGHVPLGVIK